MMAESVSTMGTNEMTSGMMIVVRPAMRVTLSSEMVPSEKPSSSDPQSPMKMDAGLKL